MGYWWIAIVRLLEGMLAARETVWLCKAVWIRMCQHVREEFVRKYVCGARVPAPVRL
jgi:hypothetical protein